MDQRLLQETVAYLTHAMAIVDAWNAAIAAHALRPASNRLAALEESVMRLQPPPHLTVVHQCLTNVIATLNGVYALWHTDIPCAQALAHSALDQYEAAVTEAMCAGPWQVSDTATDI
jgi:hypothetical protein